MLCGACFKQCEDAFCSVIVVDSNASDKAGLAINKTVDDNLEAYQT